MKSYGRRTFLAVLLTLQSGAAFGFGIEAKGRLKVYGQPVHETITQKAALDSGFISAAQTQEMKHLLEGVRFNAVFFVQYFLIHKFVHSRVRRTWHRCRERGFPIS